MRNRKIWIPSCCYSSIVNTFLLDELHMYSCHLFQSHRSEVWSLKDVWCVGIGSRHVNTCRHYRSIDAVVTVVALSSKHNYEYGVRQTMLASLVSNHDQPQHRATHIVC